MEGVTFNGLHSYIDWGLILTSVTISPPDPKTYTVEVPGADGVIDITDFMGDLRYDNRTITIEFAYEGNHVEQLKKYSMINNSIQGKKMNITIDADANYHYEGRASVSKCKHMPYACTFEVKCDVEPYKYHIDDDWLWDPFDFNDGFYNELSNIAINGSLDVLVIGNKKNSVPWITCTDLMTLLYNGVQYDLKAGSNRNFDIKIDAGRNYFQFIGNGSVSISFKGGDL